LASSSSVGDALTQADARVLSLFERPGAVETPTPGVRAWLARDTSESQRPVLVKRLAAGGANKARATEALALRHAGVVRTRRWLFEPGPGGSTALYVVRDVVRGRNLKQVLTGTAAAAAAAEPEALRGLLLPVIEALEYAHGAGVAHGGVSAENILVGDDGGVYLSDFATADPAAPQHRVHYAGAATKAGDVLALRRLVAKYLPRGGAFASPVVRGRIEGIVERCDSLADLRTAVLALERLAAAPVPQSHAGTGGSAVSPPARPPVPAPTAARGTAPPLSPGERTGEFAAVPAPTAGPGLTPMGPPGGKAGGDVIATAADEPSTQPTAGRQTPPEHPGVRPGAPRLTCIAPDGPARVAQGGGGAAALMLRNEGGATLIVRMIATQHAWLNVRPMELPLSIPPGGAASVSFVLSAARLTPGDYRSEVYLSANAPGPGAEDLRGGWFKHTCEVRISVEPPGLGIQPW